MFTVKLLPTLRSSDSWPRDSQDPFLIAGKGSQVCPAHTGQGPGKPAARLPGLEPPHGPNCCALSLVPAKPRVHPQTRTPLLACLQPSHGTRKSSGGEYSTCKPLSARIRSPSHITFKATSVLSSDSINNNSDCYCYRFCPACSVSGSVSELELLGIFTSISQRRARYRKPDFQNI